MAEPGHGAGTGAGAAHDALMPPPPGGTAPGAALSLLVHGGLVAALAWGVAWRSPPPVTVSAELWAAVPQEAAPPAEQTPPPAPAPTPPPPPQEQADKAARAAKAEKAAREKAEKAERDKAVQEKQAREAAQRKREEAAEEKRLAQQREENLKRMMGQIPAGSGAPGSRGTAAVDAAPSRSYAGLIVKAVKPNIVFTDVVSGNPEAVIEVRAAPTGTIIGRRLVKSSGSREWDEAVLRAIDRTGSLPKDTDGRVPGTVEIVFRPKD
ncbi:MAG: cell envelope integrity protein TolA [Rubrivivax sp.]|nr:cell envelope integrity protein TolA [Rubrivivax sp.]